MPEVDHNTSDQLQLIESLKEKNALLEAKLSYYRSIFRQISGALQILGEIDQEAEKNQLVKNLIQENDQLKRRLQIEQLTNREKEVLRLLSHGYTSKEIALQLDISKLTVDTYRKHIQKKLKVSNIAELVRLTIEGGF